VDFSSRLGIVWFGKISGRNERLIYGGLCPLFYLSSFLFLLFFLFLLIKERGKSLLETKRRWSGRQEMSLCRINGSWWGKAYQADDP